jgi:hypothetical protein
MYRWMAALSVATVLAIMPAGAWGQDDPIAAALGDLEKAEVGETVARNRAVKAGAQVALSLQEEQLVVAGEAPALVPIPDVVYSEPDCTSGDCVQTYTYPCETGTCTGTYTSSVAYAPAPGRGGVNIRIGGNTTTNVNTNVTKVNLDRTTIVRGDRPDFPSPSPHPRNLPSANPHPQGMSMASQNFRPQQFATGGWQQRQPMAMGNWQQSGMGSRFGGGGLMSGAGASTIGRTVARAAVGTVARRAIGAAIGGPFGAVLGGRGGGRGLGLLGR